jgi:hypothetical protein
VKSNYSFMLHLLREIAGNPEKLHNAIAEADALCAATRGAEHEGEVLLAVEYAKEGTPIAWESYDFELEQSRIMGGPVVRYSDTPRVFNTVIFDQIRPDKLVAPAAAYLIPAAWDVVIERLAAHGVPLRRLSEEVTIEAEVYRFKDVTFPEQPYEGHHAPRYTVQPVLEQCTLPAGTVVVRQNGAWAKLAAHLLEPEAPDAFVAWGLMNGIFERKEYFETYVMEPIAAEMLEENPILARAFWDAVAEDPQMATDARARLMFFYKFSPYYDQAHNRYPIVRVLEEGTAAGLPLGDAE